MKEEYRLLRLQYYKLAGKAFKRNGNELYNKISKLEAIKKRIKKLEKKKDSENPHFELRGAL
jgi:hypothetical protein